MIGHNFYTALYEIFINFYAFSCIFAFTATIPPLWRRNWEDKRSNASRIFVSLAHRLKISDFCAACVQLLQHPGQRDPLIC